jgi:hypothetical protein
MRRAAGAFGRIAMDRQHHLGSELGRPCQHSVEVVDLGPKENTVAAGLRVWAETKSWISMRRVRACSVQTTLMLAAYDPCGRQAAA